MSTENTGGPAFPTSDWDENDRAYKMHGMTLRDYFAAHASEEDIDVALSDMKKGNHVRKLDGGRAEVFYGLPDNARQIARYMVADAMLKARKQ